MKYQSQLRFDDENDSASQDAAQATEQNAEAFVHATRSSRKRHKDHREKQPASNPHSKWQQRRAIRKQYAATKAGNSAQTSKQAAERGRETAKRTAAFVRRHKKGFLIVGAFGLLLAFMLGVFSSCSILLEGVGSAVSGSTYPSKDTDMQGAETDYCRMEAELQAYLDNYENTHSYDEYHYDLDSIEHDPYVLISILTAWRQGAWTQEEVQGALQTLFDKQYILTEDVTAETRYRTETWTDGDGNVFEVEVPYTYTICNVKLENLNLSHLPVYTLSEEQLSLYALYMGTLGNRTDLFPESPYIARYTDGYTDYDIPAALLEDERFAAMIAEAEKYLGYPYVWGGSSPSTSFDCSGFVSWVINHCGQGWDYGRRGSDSLYFDVCTPIQPSEARPGDLIFFQKTYDTPYTSHVGIYVGNGMMLHCGDPIQYANINTNYWQQHFYGFGRLP